MNNIQILGATMQDAGNIAKIQSEAWVCAYPNANLGISKEDVILKTEEYNQQGLDRIIKEISKEGAKTWIAKIGEKTVGFIGASKYEEVGKIEALHVLPSAQGQGVGTLLLKTKSNFPAGI